MRSLSALLLVAIALLAADGWYKGKWESQDGSSSGALNIRLEPKPEVTFTVDGSNVTGTIVDSKVDANAIEITFDYSYEGSDSRAILKGTRNAGVLEGTYRSSPKAGGEAVNTGTFKVTAAE